MRKVNEVDSKLVPKLLDLIKYAYLKDVDVTIDAEEQDRLSLSIYIIEKLALEKNIKNWNGFGIALQAYGKRSIEVIDFLNNVLKKRDQMHIRLVKGAYWDYEIKHAQVNSYEGYPVFTKKSFTDIAYLACAKTVSYTHLTLPTICSV